MSHALTNRLALLAGCLALAAGLTACGGDSGREGSDGDDSQLVVAAPDDAVTLDPVFSAAPRGTEIIMNAYDPMMTYGVDDGEDGVRVVDLTEVVGLSLESIEPNDDFTEWTLKLRPGLKFPDGSPVTIEDVRYTFERSIDFKDSPGAFMYGVIAQIPGLDAVEVVDDETIRLKLAGPNQMLPRVLALTNAGIVQKSVVEEHATEDDPFAGDWMARNTAGAGAYRLAQWQPGRSIVLEANPNYQGDPKPSFQQITYRIVPSAANRVALLRTGEVDIAQGLSSEDIQALEGVDGVKVVSVPNAYQLSLVMNNKKAPFDDLKVREAISHAVPYEKIIEEVYGGRAQPTAGGVPVGFPGHTDEGYPYGRQDLDRARQLLQEAGRGDGFSVTMQLDSGSPDQEKAAVLIQAALREIGIDVRIEKLTSSVFNERRQTFELEFFLNLTGWDVADPAYALTLGYACEAFGNYAQRCDKGFDKRVAEATGEADPERREQLFADLQRELWEDAPQVWIAQPNFTFAMRDDIEGYTDAGDLRIRFKYLRRK